MLGKLSSISHGLDYEERSLWRKTSSETITSSNSRISTANSFGKSILHRELFQTIYTEVYIRIIICFLLFKNIIGAGEGTQLTVIPNR